MTRRLRSDDGGFALVAAIMVLMIAVSVAGFALAATATSRSGSLRADRTQRAQQAADAGAQSTLYQLNQSAQITRDPSTVGPLSTVLSCLPLQLNATLNVAASFAVVGVNPPSAGCGGGLGTPTATPPVERTGHHTSHQSWVNPGATTVNGLERFRPYTVTVGREDGGTPANTSDDVLRRVKVQLSEVAPLNAIEGSRNVSLRGRTLGLLGVNLPATAVTVNGDILAAGAVSVEPLALLGLQTKNLLDLSVRSAMIQHGGAYSGPVIAVASNVTVDPSTLPVRLPVTIDPAKPRCPTGQPCPAVTTGEVLTIGAGGITPAAVTLGAGDYVFCGLDVRAAGSLTTSATMATRIYIDDPASARCAATPPATVGDVTIKGTLGPISVAPSLRQIYLAGSSTPGATTVVIDPPLLGGEITNAMLLYAPRSDIHVKYTTFTGSVIGRDVIMETPTLVGTVGVITADLGLSQAAVSQAISGYSQRQYVECSPVDVNGATAATTAARDC